VHAHCCLQVMLAEYGLGALAFYYLGPALLGAAFGSLRGFAGEVTAAQALDLVGSDGSAVIIDIRTEVSGRGGQGRARRTWAPELVMYLPEAIRALHKCVAE